MSQIMHIKVDRAAPPLLLLHGFPQTHVMWHRVAQAACAALRLVMPDLRGYGDSSKPPGAADHANYSKRTMAADMAALMRALGHERFSIGGHDRGGRVAHRLALDHANAVDKLCVIDIAPTLDMYDATDMRFATRVLPLVPLIQPAPLPERMIGSDARFYLHWKLGAWGSAGHRSRRARSAGRIRALLLQRGRGPCGVRRLPRVGRHRPRARPRFARRGRDDRMRHARAVGQARHRCIGSSTRSRCGARNAARRVVGHSMPAGHFIPEELPDETAAALRSFVLD